MSSVSYAGQDDIDPSRHGYYSSSRGNVRELVFSDYRATSQMSDAERCAMIMLLDKIRPECAIEVGTADGGSLSMISRHAKKVYSLDIDPSCKERYQIQFPNAEFIVGDSKVTLPKLLAKIHASGEKLGFVLIDGLHTAQGVRTDIESLLAYEPVCPLYILLHDSFNPECRSGMASAPWASNPYVHYVELDFVSGQYNRVEGGNSKQMWCGLALAVMQPGPRAEELIVNEDERPLYEAVLRLSAHRSNIRSKAARQLARDFDTKYLGGFLRSVAGVVRPWFRRAS